MFEIINGFCKSYFSVTIAPVDHNNHTLMGDGINI